VRARAHTHTHTEQSKFISLVFMSFFFFRKESRIEMKKSTYWQYEKIKTQRML